MSFIFPANLPSNLNTEASDISQTKRQSENILSETFLNVLSTTLQNPNDTLNSTFTASHLDATYDSNQTLDDSVTEQKRVAQTQDTVKNNDKGKHSKSKPKDKPTPEKENFCIDSTKEEIICNDSCFGDTNSAFIRCNLCFVWYHTNCVGIDDLDCVEAWVCADCQTLPRTVKSLKIQMETLFETQANFFKAFTVFSEKMDKKFENLNDRLTVISSQNKS